MSQFPENFVKPQEALTLDTARTVYNVGVGKTKGTIAKAFDPHSQE